jgi:outer membrane protein assembly factor BamE (lipoprotein component of BamABCDE complex)
MGITNNRGVFGRLVLVAAFGLTVSACAPQYSNHGYMPPADQLEQIAVGVDTRASVEETIGVPATSGVVNETGFYYVSSRQRTFGALAPQVIEREVLAISFDSAGVVTNIETFGMERGQVVPLTRRVTTSGVRDNSFLRQLLGNLGRFNPAGLAG